MPLCPESEPAFLRPSVSGVGGWWWTPLGVLLAMQVRNARASAVVCELVVNLGLPTLHVRGQEVCLHMRVCVCVRLQTCGLYQQC
jgi:hypothetical protein